MSDQAARFRDKIRARNLGLVEVTSYPPNPQARQQQRVLSKLELHREHGREQGSEDFSAKSGDDKRAVETKAADAKVDAVVTPETKPKADAKSGDDKRK